MKVTKISNPLTVIAIFAAFCETACVWVLPSLKDGSQKLFLWFVIGFPTGLLLLFFLTLWFKPGSLYAPADYETDTGFLKANKIENNTYDSPTGIGIITQQNIP